MCGGCQLGRAGALQQHRMGKPLDPRRCRPRPPRRPVRRMRPPGSWPESPWDAARLGPRRRIGVGLEAVFSPRTAARNRSSGSRMNFSPESSASQMIRLPSTSSPTTLSSRMSTSSGLAPSPISRTLLCYLAVTRLDTPGGQRRSTTQSTHCGQRADVVGLHGREHRRPAAGCGRVCGTARCRRCRWPVTPWRPPRHRRRRRSRRCRPPATATRDRSTNGVANVDASAQRVQPLRRVRGALDGPVQPAVAQQPVELLGEQDQRADRRGVVGLVLQAVLDGDRQRQEVGHPAARRRRSPRCGPAPRATGSPATARRRWRSSSAARSSRRRRR